MFGFQGTVVGLRYKGGIALAGDSRATSAYVVMSKSAEKLFKIQDKIGVAISGSPGDTRKLADILETESNLYELRRKKDIKTDSLASLASNLLHSQRMFPYITSIILAGTSGEEPKLFSLDPAGGKLEEEKFTSAGTGASVAYGVLEQNYEKDMSPSEGIRLATKSIEQAIERDAATGDNVVVAKIDEDGYQELPEEEIKDLLE
ncbi:MAG: proteasome subunit beta [Hadesarchaea archaeon]|nr:proteasome subunit beta [Hadesarchaea archaeon]